MTQDNPRICPLLAAAASQDRGNDLDPSTATPCTPEVDPGASGVKFAGETDLETNPDGSVYRSRYSFRVF